MLIFDFDGTLAPIVPRAEDATLDPELAAELEKLRPLVGGLVVVSGRDESQLRERLPESWWAIGSYGLELPRELEPSGHPPGLDAVSARASLARARTELSSLVFNWPGARLEVKTFGLAVHFRGAERPPDAELVLRVLRPLARRHDLRLVSGRLVYELRPDVDVDKGSTVRLLAARLNPSALVFSGDDVGDVPAWKALRELEGKLATLAVGVASAETPPDAMRACDLVLPSRDGLVSFFSRLRQIVE